VTPALASTPGSGGSFAAVIVVVIVLAACAAAVSYVMTQRRRKEFAAWAAQHGWSYAIEDDRYSDMPWGPPFGIGFGRSARDVLTATVDGHPAVCFTYLYKTRSSNGKTTTTQSHWFSIYSIRMPKPLPELEVGREGILSSIARAIGVHDIEFESEQFNREFKVKADDRKFAYDVVNPQMMQFLMSTGAPGFTTRGADLVLVQGGKMDLASVLPTVGYLTGVLAHIPNFVWDAH
jgi:hypothetical protein